MKEKYKVEIRYGVLSPSLSEQIWEQGFRWIDKDKGRALQKAVDDVIGLWYKAYLTEKEKHRALSRIHKALLKNIEPK